MMPHLRKRSDFRSVALGVPRIENDYVSMVATGKPAILSASRFIDRTSTLNVEKDAGGCAYVEKLNGAGELSSD